MLIPVKKQVKLGTTLKFSNKNTHKIVMYERTVFEFICFHIEILRIITIFTEEWPMLNDNISKTINPIIIKISFLKRA
jgi:hypothetical protein